MKKTTWLLTVILMLGAAATSQAYDDGDFQVWLKAEASGKITDTLSVKIEEELRYGDGASELYDEESLLMATFKLADWVKLGLGYRVVQELKYKTVVTPKTAEDGTVTYSDVGDGDHYWQNEKRPTVELVFSRKAAGWGLEDRVRFERRMKDDGKDNYMRSRNRLKVKSPYKLTELAMNPYVAWELFHEDKEELSGSDKVNRHRYYAGVSGKLADHLKGGVYYMRQVDRDGNSWKKTNVAGLEVGASF